MSIFEKMLREAGMPVTEEDMRSRWNAINEEEGSLITNDSKWSPFWRLVSAIVTAPCKMLVDLLMGTALPNLFLQTASGNWLDVFAWGVDLKRKNETQASGTVTFTRTSVAGELLIKAGTIIESPKLEGMIYRVKTMADTTIPDGSLSLDIAVEAEHPGAAYNLGPGYYSILQDPVPGIAAVTNGADWLLVPGADREQDEELRLRCRNQFSAVGQYHHDAAYRASISEVAGIRTDYIFFEHGAPRGPGSANAYVMIENGAPPQSFINEINIRIRDDGLHGHGDDMVCFPMPEKAYALKATVYPIASTTEDKTHALLLEVENRIRCAFRENSDYDMTRTMPFNRFSLSRLGQELHGIADLQSVEFDRVADIVSDMELPVLGTLIVELGGA